MTAAFPSVCANDPCHPASSPGMSMRDYLAAHCPDGWIERFRPDTLGGVRDALIARKIIPVERAKGDVCRSYNDKDRMKLDAALRWEYADLMLEMGKS